MRFYSNRSFTIGIVSHMDNITNNVNIKPNNPKQLAVELQQHNTNLSRVIPYISHFYWSYVW